MTGKPSNESSRLNYDRLLIQVRLKSDLHNYILIQVWGIKRGFPCIVNEIRKMQAPLGI